MKFPHKPTPKDLYKIYSDGFEGWIWNAEVEEQWEEYCSHGMSVYDINPDLKGLSKKVDRALLYLAREKFDPGAFGQEQQTTGDCTSHGSRNCRDTSRSVEILNGDAETYYKRTATEPTYGARGHSGQGMDPYRAAKFESEYGFLFREVYTDPSKGINLDLSKYNANIGINWGRSGVPDRVKELCKQFNVGQTVRPKTIEEANDLFAAGKACHSGQSWGTSGQQPRDGINRKSGSWNHDMATVGYDFTKEVFKENVYFVVNSWGFWNEKNPMWVESIYGKWVPGMIVVPADEWEQYFLRSGSIHFYSEVNGYRIMKLPSVHTGVL